MFCVVYCCFQSDFLTDIRVGWSISDNDLLACSLLSRLPVPHLNTCPLPSEILSFLFSFSLAWLCTGSTTYSLPPFALPSSTSTPHSNLAIIPTPYPLPTPHPTLLHTPILINLNNSTAAPTPSAFSASEPSTLPTHSHQTSTSSPAPNSRGSILRIVGNRFLRNVCISSFPSSDLTAYRCCALSRLLSPFLAATTFVVEMSGLIRKHADFRWW